MNENISSSQLYFQDGTSAALLDEQFKGSEVCSWPWSCAHCCSTFAVKRPWFKNIIRDLKLVDQTHYKYLNSVACWTKAQKESKAISRIHASPIHNESLPFLFVSKFTNSSLDGVCYIVELTSFSVTVTSDSKQHQELHHLVWERPCQWTFA